MGGLQGAPVQTDDNATRSLIRFFRGDRDNQLKSSFFPDLVAGNDKRSYRSSTRPTIRRRSDSPYNHRLGDIFHSDPSSLPPLEFLLPPEGGSGLPELCPGQLEGRRIVFSGANDGFVHAFDAGVWGRDSRISRRTGTRGPAARSSAIRRVPFCPLTTLFIYFETEAPVAYWRTGRCRRRRLHRQRVHERAERLQSGLAAIVVGGLRQGGLRSSPWTSPSPIC